MFWDKERVRAIFLEYGPAGRLKIHRKRIVPESGTIRIEDWGEVYFVPEPEFSRGFRDFVYIRGRAEPLDLYTGEHFEMNPKTLMEALDSTLLEKLVQTVVPRRFLLSESIANFVESATSAVAENVRRAWYGYQKRN